ncbi:MAG: SMP-30/gluconolactonase/LRE family protein [Halioglobus sp.]|nr:SMP-30/gluconolactonase/LRE family protein [Halioglobus sp.]
MRNHLALLACTVIIATACSDSSDSSHSAAAQVPLSARYELSSPDSVPEGVAFDPQQRAFYTTSLQGGGIVRIDAGGRETVFRAADNRAQVGGTKVDAERRRLWACAQGVDGGDSRVWVFDLDSAERVMEFFLGAINTNASCNDLVLNSEGVAYVTDPANPFLYRLDPDTGVGDILATDPLFRDVTGAGLGLNGIALSPDGSALIVAVFFPAGLLRVGLPDGDSIEPIALSGDALPSPDGLAVLDGDLYAVSGDSVSRVRPGPDFRTGEVVNVAQESGLSTATVAESRLYVIKSDVVNYVLKKPLELPFAIFHVDSGLFGD